MTSGQEGFPTAPSRFEFSRHGENGVELSELLPHLAQVVDDVCIIRSMYTEAINHDPAITFFQTGSQIPGRPSMGSWLTYGLGSESADLPAFVAMSSKGSGKAGQPLYDRLWGSGFLPAKYQGVKFRNIGAPVLDIENPPGVDCSAAPRDGAVRRTAQPAEVRGRRGRGDPDPDRPVRACLPDADLRSGSGRSDAGAEVDVRPVRQRRPHAGQVRLQLPDRPPRLAEQGVRFIQLYHQGWDQHGNLPVQLPKQTRDTDQATAALITDLKQRGMLDETLIVWGGEFGRTVYCQGKLTDKVYGRDHHPNCFTMWLAGGGVQGGITYGATDDYSVNVVENGVHVHDLQATILHLMGIDHRAADLQVPGPRLPPDRRAWARGG